ncbi:ImmA/IrrE family metallo-endopeptidase [Intestinimonas butyriciproducens]|uniref:ImmA/IrrE family metallo-endopeptidase n=1 Tax=Intestinimonas butyriciproducens TaxID=1297617 RepID=UPI003AEF4241
MKYSCPPLSRKQIREYARCIRRALKIEGLLWFPVEQFLETLHLLTNDEDLYFQIIPDDEWNQPPNRHAYFDLNDDCIYIKESIYVGACNGNGRDRMTIVHECAHVLLIRHSHLTLARSFDDDIPIYCDPEWQAKCLAGELMVPADRVQGISASDVSARCGVSKEAARYQLNKI